MHLVFSIIIQRKSSIRLFCNIHKYSWNSIWRSAVCDGVVHIIKKIQVYIMVVISYMVAYHFLAFNMGYHLFNLVMELFAIKERHYYYYYGTKAYHSPWLVERCDNCNKSFSLSLY